MVRALIDPDPLVAASEDSRSRLVTAASRLIHEKSYHSVGVKAICDVAGVNRGSFYHHFESKQALAIAALDRRWEQFDREVLAPCRDTTGSPRLRLESVVVALHDKHERTKLDTGRVLGCVFGNLAAESTPVDEPVRRRLTGIFTDWAAALALPIAAAQKQDEIQAHIPARELASQMLAALQGLTLLAKVRNDPAVIVTGGQAFIDHMLGPAASGDAQVPAEASQND